MAPHRRYTATNADRIFDKVRESHYFLGEMNEHERAGDIEKFMFSLSAFLKAFRSIKYRLFDVVEARSTFQLDSLKKQLDAHVQIKFLIDRANLEVHGDGPVIWKRFNISVSESLQRYPARLQSRFANPTRWFRRQSRFEPATVETRTVVSTDWQFAGNSASLLEMCRTALDEIETLVKQNISVPQPTP